MNITLMGYGRMGHEIEKMAQERGHHINARIDVNSLQDQKEEALQNADVVIEFTQPDAVLANIDFCLAQNTPVVTGTTGWHEALEEVAHKVSSSKGAVFYASNFSIGVNILFHLNALLARIMGNYPDYKAEMEEVHHIHKKDSPSGTAVTLAQQILANHPAYAKWREVENIQEASGDILPIVAKRENEVPGIHRVTYGSAIDEITLSHSAKNRKGFALGAVLAAEWMVGKKGLYTMKDMLNFE